MAESPRVPGNDAAAWSATVRALALEVGFSRVGFARAHDRPEDLARLRAWLDAGMHGPMAWMAKDPARRCDPGLVVVGARSAVVLALDYDSDAPRSVDVLGRQGDAAPAGTGWISRYAWGDDYHLVAERRLRALTERVEAVLGPRLPLDFRGAGADDGPFDARRDFRWEVDYGPMLERRWAEEAGLGWQGKHTLLVDPARGSYFFLATIITTIELVPDAPVADHCGSCTRCIDVCPTQAIVAPRLLDARRCLSTLTIETRGPLEPAEAALLGDHVFGCDLCQDVCPFNRFSRPSGEPGFAPREGLVAPDLAALAALDDKAFAARFAKSAVKRNKREGLQRNVDAVLANQARRGARPAPALPVASTGASVATAPKADDPAPA